MTTAHLFHKRGVLHYVQTRVGLVRSSCDVLRSGAAAEASVFIHVCRLQPGPFVHTPCVYTRRCSHLAILERRMPVALSGYHLLSRPAISNMPSHIGGEEVVTDNVRLHSVCFESEVMKRVPTQFHIRHHIAYLWPFPLYSLDHPLPVPTIRIRTQCHTTIEKDPSRSTLIT